MNDFMTDTDIGMDGNWMTYQEDDLTNNEKAEMAENWETYLDGQHQIEDWQNTPEQIEIMAQEERNRLMELDGDDRTRPHNEIARKYELDGGDGMGPNDEIPMDWGREALQEQGIEAYADLPFIRKIDWDLPE